MIYFTSDWHLGETRLGDITKGEFNPFFRPFKSKEEQDNTIIYNINAVVGEDDVLYHLGDVAMDDESIDLLKYIHCKNMHLIMGNYDYDKIGLLEKYFDKRFINLVVRENFNMNLVHCPVDAYENMFNVVGHIHGLWKVKRNMVNVGVDAWHFRPVSIKEVEFVKNAIDKGFYDENVFYGEQK